MSKEIKLPELGENIEAGDVIRVLVAKGDNITKDQPIIEVETDKAAIEVPAPIAGRIEEILIKEGESASVGQTLMTVTETGSKETSDKGEKKKATAPDTVKPSNGRDHSEPTPQAPVEPTQQPKKSASLPKVSPLIPAAPSVRRRARELGIDLNYVAGSNFGGRISVLDVERTGSAPVVAPGMQPGVTLPDFSKWGNVRREKMSNVRRVTATHLSQTWATVPQVTQYDLADITDVEKLRKQFADKAQEHGGKLTITAILLKVCGAALKKFPQFNASVDMTSQQIIFKDYVNVGVAVDTDRGLLVPVVRDVVSKSVFDLARELTETSVKARDKKLSIDDMQGGNFTISNLGGIGGVGFSPIVNAPEVAILGVSRGSIQPKMIDDAFVPRMMMPLSLSYDHRLIDGADAARFLRFICESLEQPALLAFEA